MGLIQARIEAEEAEEDTEDSKIKLTDFGKVILGSARQPITFANTEKTHTGPSYKNFTSIVNEFFKEQAAEGHDIEQQLGETTEYVQSYFLVIFTQSHYIIFTHRSLVHRIHFYQSPLSLAC